MPGEVIAGKYTIGDVIGSGGMGTVYEAVHNDINRRVAIKFLHSRYAKLPKIVRRFHQEAQFAGSIEHDNICRVIDHGTSKSGAPYLVMPLLTGRPLGKILEGNQKLPWLQVVDIACQTLQALAAAHHQKVVHRDLKPDNIFITRVGDREDFVKLLDFGISKVLEKDNPSELTATGMVLGTAYYLAPEQARGSKRIDHRVDIYAMGVILYEALTGVRPFEGDSYNEVVFKIAGEPVKPPRVLNPSIPLALERVILKAMAIDPAARFASAMDMCRALEQSVVSDDGSASDLESTLADTAVDGARPVTRTVKRSSRKIVTAGVIGIFLIGGLVIISRSTVNPNAGALLSSADQDTLKHGTDNDTSAFSSTGEPVSDTSGDTEERVATDVDASPLKSFDNGKTERSSLAEGLSPPSIDGSKTVEPTSSSERTEPAMNTPKSEKHHRKPSKKRKKSDKKPKDGVITGKFNSKFVFEEN